MSLDPSRILIVAKATKLEYDCQRLGRPRRQVIASYRGENVDVIVASHKRQLAMRALVQRLLSKARVIDRSDLEPRIIKDASLVVSLGGDNHFIYVASFLDAAPILGINADQVRSHGGLLSVSESNVVHVVRDLLRGRLPTEAWTRLCVQIDDQSPRMALSEVFLGEARRRDMSRHVLQISADEEEQKSSGLLIATGAGSTGWYGSYGRAFGRTRLEARWALTEPFPRKHRYRWAKGRLRKGETVVIRSRNDSEGVVSVDCLTDISFAYGSVARISVATLPLHVVRVNET